MKGSLVRRRIDAALLVLGCAMVIAAAVPSLAAVRAALALPACILLPGAAVLTVRPVDTILQWSLLSILLSLAIETTASLLMLWLGFWHPLLFASALGVVSVVLIGTDFIRAAPAAAAP